MNHNSKDKLVRCLLMFLGSFLLLFSSNKLLSQTLWTQIGPKKPAMDISNFDPNISGNGLMHRVMFEPQYNGTTNTRLFAWSYSGLWVSPSGQGNDWQVMNTDQLDDASFSSIAVDPKNRNHIIATTGTLSGIKFHSLHHRLEHKYSTGFWNGNLNSKTSKWEWTRISGCSFKENFGLLKTKESDFFEYTNHRLMTNICFNSNNPKELVCSIVEIINPTDPAETYKSSIYKSNDGGETWIRKFEVSDIFLKDLLAIGNNVFITGRRNPTYTSAAVVFKSSDFGNKWNKDFCFKELVNGNSKNLNFFSDYIYYNIAFSPKTPGCIYVAGFANEACQTLKIDITKIPNQAQLLPSSSELKLYNNNGKSDAFDISPGDSNAFIYGGWHMAFVKYNANIIANDFPKFYGGSSNDFHQDVRDLIFYPATNAKKKEFNSCIVACDGGVYKGTYDSTTASLIFTNISDGLEILNCTDISCTQNAESINGRYIDEVMVNTWDNGLYKYLPGGKWNHSGVEGNEVTVKPNDYKKYYYQFFPQPGNTFAEGYENNFQHFRSKAIYNSANPNQFYLIDNYSSASVIRVSEDSAGRLTEVPLGVNDNDLTAFDVCASNTNVIAVAKFFRVPSMTIGNVGRLYWTTNGGLTWPIVDVTFSNGKLNEITDIVICPNNAEKAWVSDYSNKVAFTADGGKTWETQLLPEEVKAIYCLYYLKGSNDLVFAGTSAGLYVYVASEKDWVQYNTYFSNPEHLLPRSIITGIDFNYNTQTMFISTFGRGVWKGRTTKR